MAQLKPSKLSNKYFYVFFNTECTEDLEKCDGTFQHVPNLICAQQICSKSQAVDDVNFDLNSVETVSTRSGKTPY